MLTLLSWGLSLGLAWRYGDHLGNYLMSWLKSAQFSYYAGIGLVFLVSLVAFTVISRVMYSQFRITDLMMTNRLLGVIFGTIRGIVISTFLLFAVQFSPAIDTDWYKESQLVPYFTPLVIFTDKSISQKLWHREI